MINSTVKTATPLYDFSIRFRHELKQRELDGNVERLKAHQNKINEYYSWKADNFFSKREEFEKNVINKNIEEVQRYEILYRNKAYENYLYQYYVGTNLDCYI